MLKLKAKANRTSCELRQELTKVEVMDDFATSLKVVFITNYVLDKMYREIKKTTNKKLDNIIDRALTKNQRLRAVF